MRAPIFVLAIVICTVTALAVLSKSRAEEEALVDAKDSVAGEAEKSKPIDTTPGEPQISSADAEQIVAQSRMGEDRLWGDRIRWSQLQSGYSTVRDGHLTQVDVMSLGGFSGPASPPRTTKLKICNEATRALDQVANDLEEAALYSEADAVRELSLRLRTKARMLPWNSLEGIRGPITFSEALYEF